MWTDGASCLNIVLVNLLSHMFLLPQILWYGLSVESCFTSVIKCCVNCCSVCVFMATYLRQARRHCCPLPQSAETHPGLRDPTCPSDPSAPACPRSPPWTTCFLLALDTTRDSKVLASQKVEAFRGQQQGAESRKRGVLIFVVPQFAKQKQMGTFKLDGIWNG